MGWVCWDWGPWIINPIYTLYHVGIGYIPFQRASYDHYTLQKKKQWLVWTLSFTKWTVWTSLVWSHIFHTTTQPCTDPVVDLNTTYPLPSMYGSFYLHLLDSCGGMGMSPAGLKLLFGVVGGGDHRPERRNLHRPNGVGFWWEKNNTPKSAKRTTKRRTTTTTTTTTRTRIMWFVSWEKY